MFIEDIRNDFYNVLLGNRVLLLVHYDVDAICACKILQELFRCDNVSYTLVPVGGLSELKSAYEENNEEVKYVVLVNCGGTVDLVDILQPDEHVVFFVLDSHKPTDICNVYSDGQVRLLYKDEEENIPNFDDIFRDDEDQENEEELEARHGLEALVERRRARKAWEERRHTLMFNYTQFSYYGKPSTSVALELAVRASRCTAAALWCASVAAAAHAALHCRSPARCLLDAEPLHRYVAAAQRKTTDDDVHQAARVVVEKDVWLPLYRWWSVEGAISHAAALAPQLRLHTHSGAARLRQLLADMGFPLQQARQAYRSMDVELRRALLPALEAAAPRQRLPAPARAAFLLQRPHAPTLAALDVVYAIMGLIENESTPRAEGFQHALAALAVGGDGESLQRGVAAARRALEAVARAAHGTLAARAVLLAGPFNYFIVQEGSPEAAALRGPLWLAEAARWVGAAHSHAPRPLLASAPGADGDCLLLGLPPRFDQEPRNLFGAAFEQAATKSGASVSLDFVDSSIISLPVSQRAQFLDALTALLA
ncbi:cell division control protein 45 homolog isoform X3 [Bicyclus anynana]|uniref:Cell division control protein 45 homolog isoform X3 n=1 Tax=Bicyclus anynana TaxID=110368 RepID=A0ABM3LJE6_BICAN|nr:cell division control protein 45 homolog isoform X3 [Bicyclus anynana]